MKSKFLLLTAALFILFTHSNAQTLEFVRDNVNYLEVSNEKLFLEIADYEGRYHGVWISDGTATGLKPLRELRTPSNNRYLECNRLNYFLAQDTENYIELWATDDTAAGTYLVKKLKPAKWDHTVLMDCFNNKLYFTGKNAKHGKELWVSDGTERGTKLLKEIDPEAGDSFGYGLAIVYKNKMFFTAGNAQNNEELWVTDGTEGGTKLFKDINPDGSSSPSGFSIVNDKLYFSAKTNKEGREMWISDGTEEGTHLVKDIAPAEGSSGPSRAIEYNGKAYFTTFGDSKFRQLWSTDGSEAGTTLGEDSVTYSITVYNGELYYGKIVGGKDSNYDYALYKNNGKPGGGKLIKVLSGGNSTDEPENFVQANGKLYFLRNYDNSGANYLNNDLWKTDGTAANTKLIEYSPGKLVEVNGQTGLREHNNALYFTDLGSKLYRIGSPYTAVSEIAREDFEVLLFPNPANNQLTIKTDSRLMDSNYTVLNIMGQTVRSGKITSDNTMLEVRDLPGGSYFVRVQSKDGNSVSRFIKE